MLSPRMLTNLHGIDNFLLGLAGEILTAGCRHMRAEWASIIGHLFVFAMAHWRDTRGSLVASRRQRRRGMTPKTKKPPHPPLKPLRNTISNSKVHEHGSQEIPRTVCNASIFVLQHRGVISNV